MLEIQRSEEFWTRIISDPSINLGMSLEEFLNFVSNPKVTPLATENGGYLIISLGVGLICEFHGVFTLLGRGKEAYNAACDLAQIIFRDHQIATTYETLSNINSRPPKSFGFQSETEYKSTEFGPMKLWYLTKSRWESSPAYKRIMNKCLQQF